MADGQTVDVQSLAALFECDPKTVQNLAKNGEIPKAAHGEYLLWPSVQGYIRYLKSLNARKTKSESAERLRLTRAQADKIELELAVTSGRLVDVAGFETALEASIVSAKTSLRQSARKIKESILETHGVEIDIKCITRHIDTALARLAECQPELDEGAASSVD